MNQQDAELIARLQAATRNLSQSDRSFANGICEAQERYGSLTDGRRTWARKLIKRASEARNPAAGHSVGDLSGILALFDKARAHLKFPTIELSVPGYSSEKSIRVNIAGRNGDGSAASRSPGYSSPQELWTTTPNIGTPSWRDCALSPLIRARLEAMMESYMVNVVSVASRYPTRGRLP